MPIFLNQTGYQRGLQRVDLNLRLLAEMIKQEAVTLLSKSGTSKPGHPPGLQSGKLRRSITVKVVGNTIQMGVLKGAEYGLWLDRGTGLYGPSRRVIRPKNASVLSWVGPDRKRRFAKFVRGAKRRPWIQQSITNARKRFRAL